MFGNSPNAIVRVIKKSMYTGSTFCGASSVSLFADLPIAAMNKGRNGVVLNEDALKLLKDVEDQMTKGVDVQMTEDGESVTFCLHA